MIEEIIVEKVRGLPLDKKQEVLDFVEFLEQRRSPSQPRRSPEGLWADLTINIGTEEIAELRREMWRNFPRDDAR